MAEDALTRAALINNLCNRLAENGDRAGACTRAREALASLRDDQEGVAAIADGWLLLLSLSGHAFPPGGGPDVWPRPEDADLLASLLGKVPPRHPPGAVLSLLTLTSWMIYFLLRPPEMGPPPPERVAQADALHDLALPTALGRADQDERRHWAALTWELICLMIDMRLLDAAIALHARQLRLADAHPDDGELRIQVGKSATELHQYLIQAGRRREAIDLLRACEPALRSAEYLTARKADLGEEPEAFLAALDATLGRRRFRLGR